MSAIDTKRVHDCLNDMAINFIQARIENADADDAMALMVLACVAADKHNKLDDVAVNIESDHDDDGLFNRISVSFDAFN